MLNEDAEPRSVVLRSRGAAQSHDAEAMTFFLPPMTAAKQAPLHTSLDAHTPAAHARPSTRLVYTRVLCLVLSCISSPLCSLPSPSLRAPDPRPCPVARCPRQKARASYIRPALGPRSVRIPPSRQPKEFQHHGCRWPQKSHRRDP